MRIAIVTCHPVERADAERAVALFTALPQLDALDAVPAATCLNRDIAVLVSADTAFDAVDGLQRLDPAVAITELLGE